MKILLVGGGGFIGRHTADRLQSAGESPVIFDSFDVQIHGDDRDRTIASLREKFEVIEGDTRDREAVERALRDVEAVYYFPASTGTGQSMYRAGDYCDTNVRGAGVFADALLANRLRIGRVVVSSSRAVYGEGAAQCDMHGRVFPHGRRAADMAAAHFESTCPHCGDAVAPLASVETDALQPVSIYGITKLAQEQVIVNAAVNCGVSCVAFRYQNVFGPGQSLKNPYTGILSIFTQLMLGDKPINVFEDGLPTRDFVYIDDVVEYNVRALRAGVEGNATANIGSGVRSSIIDLVEALGQALGREAAYAVSGDFRLGDIRHAVADTSRLFELFGAHDFVPLQAGVQKFTEWVVAQELSATSHASFLGSLQEMRDTGLLRTASRS